MNTIFWTSVILLLYVYSGYFLLLKLLSTFRRETVAVENNSHYSVSIVVSAYNEGDFIKRRIENLLHQDYLMNRAEIIVASDGSTDETVRVARNFEPDGIRVLESSQNRGRASVQNEAVKAANGNIVVFTDAETEFDRDFLKNLTKYFTDERVGCVVGNLFYKTEGTSISESEGFYWKFEKKLRKMESDIGILATATGACMAVRKDLWRNLSLIDDSDFITPLDVIMQGHRVVYAQDAVACDVPPSSMRGELKARIRQTSKNLIGTLKRWGWKGWIRHPLVSWGILSHKILRWFTPFFMAAAFISNIFLLRQGPVYSALFAGQVAFYILAAVGLVGELLRKRIPVAPLILGFCVANVGMGIGVIKGLAGKAPAVYKKAR